MMKLPVAALPLCFLGLTSSAMAAPVCLATKFHYNPQAHKPIDQETACLNDGSLEFCLPRFDAKTQEDVKKKFPNVGCFDGRYIGRVGCKPETQVLCLYKIAQADCEPRDRKRMTDQAWARVCELSQVEAIEGIAATWER